MQRESDAMITSRPHRAGFGRRHASCAGDDHADERTADHRQQLQRAPERAGSRVGKRLGPTVVAVMALSRRYRSRPQMPTTDHPSARLATRISVRKQTTPVSPRYWGFEGASHTLPQRFASQLADFQTRSAANSGLTSPDLRQPPLRRQLNSSNAAETLAA